MLFSPAKREGLWLRMALAGPSGSGKSYTSMLVASELCGGKPFAVIDTERKTSLRYADVFSFDVAHLSPPYHPNAYMEALNAAVDGGYKVVVVDSISHAWMGEGGVLDIVNNASARGGNRNQFAAWGKATPIQNRFIDALVSAECHIICTLRSKQEYAQTPDQKGKLRVVKLGMQPIQRDGVEYEFDIFIDMDLENSAIVQKSRFMDISGKVIEKPGKEFAQAISRWLGNDVSAPPPTPQKPHSTPARNGRDQARKMALEVFDGFELLQAHYSGSRIEVADSMIRDLKAFGLRLSQDKVGELLFDCLERAAESLFDEVGG